MADGKIPQEFEVGEPVLVCRWRLSNRRLPAANRHLRALGRRTVNGMHPTKQLLGWAKQHIEWTLAEGSAAHPDGVLMLVLDAQGRAAMAVGDYAPLADTTLAALVDRARASEHEASETDVAPETLWVVLDGALVCGMAPGEVASGSASLIADLARTLGLSVRRDANLVEAVADGTLAPREAFLVSDEHGVVVASDASGDRARRFADGWARLLDRAGR